MATQSNYAAIVLAAGAGTRMKSNKAKVTHKILEKPLINWVIDAAKRASIEKIVTVVGHKSEQVIPLVKDKSEIVFQKSLDGTAGAVRICKDAFIGFEGSIVVLSGDTPLVSDDTLGTLLEMREKTDASVAVLTMVVDNPYGYGRIIRDTKGEVERIVEEKDASNEERSINECNSGIYCFKAQDLFIALEQVNSNNAQNEFYLTDVIEIARKTGKKVIAHKASHGYECMGINSRIQLAQAAKCAQRLINEQHMDEGVTMIDPDLVWVGPDVKIGQDGVLFPGTHLYGKTQIGQDCTIGPNSRIYDSKVADGCVVDESVLKSAEMEEGSACGPRAYLRPETVLCAGAKAGTHVEIKKSIIGPGSKVPHLSYIGDTTMGADVNIGAGSITCNYDGKHKNPTIIGDGVFVGSDTMLVAPVKIGEGAVTGAGSVIARDVAQDALALTRPEHVEIPQWAKKKREKFAKE